MAVLVWPNSGSGGGSTSGVQNPMNDPMVFNSTVEINDVTTINSALISSNVYAVNELGVGSNVPDVSLFLVNSAGIISVTPNVGGTGNSTQPTLSSNTTDWAPSYGVYAGDVTSGSYATNYAWWERNGNIITGSLSLRFKVTSAITAGNSLLFHATLPVTASQTDDRKLIGTAQFQATPTDFSTSVVAVNLFTTTQVLFVATFAESVAAGEIECYICTIFKYLASGA